MSALQEAFDARLKYTHFRILVIGRANAGKTTLLKRVCNTDEEPCIYDEEDNNLVSTSSLSVGNFISQHLTFQVDPTEEVTISIRLGLIEYIFLRLILSARDPRYQPLILF